MIILFFILINNLFSQDLEPASMQFMYKGTVINIDQNRFKQNNFLLGWQWGSKIKMINAMGTNVVSGGSFNEKSPYESWETSNYILPQPGKKAAAWERPFIQAAAWFTYEPGLLIPNNKKFVTFSDDPSNPVFGFKYITEYGTVTFTNDNDDNGKKHYRLALYEDNFSSSTQSVVKVLSESFEN